MPEQISPLEALGFNDWFQAQATSGDKAREQIARVAAVDRDQLLLLNETGAFRAKLAGRLVYLSSAAQELPCVGDWVCVSKSPGDEFGLIHEVLERQTWLRRKAPGEPAEYQMIAANVDYVVIVQSCHYDFNLKRLERYLVMIASGGASPYILLTKTDLVAPQVLSSQIQQIRSAGISASLLTLSNVTGEGIENFKRMLTPGQTYCFVGSSGVGKSTLINALIGHQHLDTKTVSDSGEGRHTSVRRELLILDNGALVIDNPGMREFGMLGAEAGIDHNFSRLMELAAQCHFGDCTHTSEPNCAVLKALASGAIDSEHYANFLKLRAESEFNQMSYVQRRKKDKDFGRLIKTVKKDRYKK